MVSAVPNPAIDAFVAQVRPQLVFGQVLVQSTPGGFELTHVEDRDAASLHTVTLTSLREIAQFTTSKQFRPLKSAPTLQRGWKFNARSSAELNDAMQCLYPGAVADWFAARQPEPPITHFREFTGRQTGMYRVTAMLTNAQAEVLARAGCHKEFCLKQRLWGVENLLPEKAAEKSLIPCLEPCALLLEFARTVARNEQREKCALSLAPEELETCTSALQRVARLPRGDVREADFGAPENPRRAQLLLEKFRAVLLERSA